MTKRIAVIAALLPLLFAGVAAAQFPILDMMAGRVVQKYQQANCEQLWEQRGKPKTAEEQDIIKMLRDDPQARTAFINKIAAPVVNKMFECGMIP